MVPLLVILLFTALPIMELSLILSMHDLYASHWGSGRAFFMSIGMIFATGILGAALARREGLQVLGKIQAALGRSELPGDEIIEGLLILVGGVLLLTPGYVTDLVGFAMILPWTRPLMRMGLKTAFRRNVDHLSTMASGGFGSRRVVFYRDGRQASQRHPHQRDHDDSGTHNTYHNQDAFFSASRRFDVDQAVDPARAPTRGGGDVIDITYVDHGSSDQPKKDE